MIQICLWKFLLKQKIQWVQVKILQKSVYFIRLTFLLSLGLLVSRLWLSCARNIRYEFPMVHVLFGFVRVQERVGDEFEFRTVAEIGDHTQRLVGLHVQDHYFLVGRHVWSFGFKSKFGIQACGDPIALVIVHSGKSDRL